MKVALVITLTCSIYFAPSAQSPRLFSLAIIRVAPPLSERLEGPRTVYLSKEVVHNGIAMLEMFYFSKIGLLVRNGYQKCNSSS